MGKKKKLIRFKENEGLKKLLQPSVFDLLKAEHEFIGRWSRLFFCNDNDIILEIGCGRGEYTLGLAKANANQNYIGVDIKGARMYFGAKEAERQHLDNALFIRTQAEMLPRIFKNEISEIWLTFSDPLPEKPRKRLSSPLFLNRYIKILKPFGKIHLKTDNKPLYDFTLGIAAENGYETPLYTDDLYGSELSSAVPNIKTLYENKFLSEGKKICYLQFILSKEAKPLKKGPQSDC